MTRWSIPAQKIHLLPKRIESFFLPMRNFKPTKMSFSVQEIAYLALLVAASVVGRTLFQPLPNVQPMTAIFYWWLFI